VSWLDDYHFMELQQSKLLFPFSLMTMTYMFLFPFSLVVLFWSIGFSAAF